MNQGAPTTSPAGRPATIAVAGRRVASFTVIGAICTAMFAALYSTLRAWMGPAEANILALALTMVVNFEANRRFTFGSPRGSLGMQALGYGAAYLAGLVASTVALQLALLALHHPGRLVETLIALAAGIVATVVRFVLLSAWVFPIIPEHLHPHPVTETE